MNILLATDKFKDALPANLVCESLKKGILQTFPTANCHTFPLADGGEGTLDVLANNLGGEFITCTVHDPLFREMKADYLWLENQGTAIIEMARASGIELLHPSERNCLKTSTLGTGELIKNAIEKGAKHVVLTVGGSATNDAGIGMASALGYSFLDEKNKVLQPVGENLSKIRYIKNDTSVTNNISFEVLTDVTNPFFGKNGAAHVFAAQKGADKVAIKTLDKGLENIAGLFQQTFNKDVQNTEGSGAGGGISGGTFALFNAKINSAAIRILEICGMAQLLEKTDFLITGEGKIDYQSWQGKLIARLIALANEHNVPVILICGTMQDVKLIAQQKIWFANSILDAPMSLENALKNTSQLLENQGILLGKLLQAIDNSSTSLCKGSR